MMSRHGTREDPMAEERKDKGILDKAKGKAAETAGGLVDKAEPLVGKAKEATSDLSSKAEPVLDKASATAGDLVEKAQPMVDKAVEAGGGLVDKARDLLSGKKNGADDGATEG